MDRPRDVPGASRGGPRRFRAAPGDLREVLGLRGGALGSRRGSICQQQLTEPHVAHFRFEIERSMETNQNQSIIFKHEYKNKTSKMVQRDGFATDA